jgi:hypothetical protein
VLLSLKPPLHSHHSCPRLLERERELQLLIMVMAAAVARRSSHIGKNSSVQSKRDW